MTEIPNQKRIILWAVPRSVSTAMFRSIMNAENVKVLLEPFSDAYYFGEERISNRYSDLEEKSNCKFSDIKEMYDRTVEENKDAKVIFSKEMAYCLGKNLDDETLSKNLPNNFEHTFIIRNPSKTIPSLYRMSTNQEKTGWTNFNPSEVGYKQLVNLYKFIEKKSGKKPLIIDADDLIQDTEQILKMYCMATDIKFTEDMLNWKSINEKSTQNGDNHNLNADYNINKDIFGSWNPWFGEVLKSKVISKSFEKSSKAIVNLPQIVVDTIKKNTCHFEYLFKRKSVPSQRTNGHNHLNGND